MKKNKSILKNGTLYLIGNIFNKAIGFVTIPIFTRILTTEEYGIVNTYSSWITILAVAVGLSLGLSIRNAYVDMPNELGQYISSIYFLSFANFLLIFLIVQLFAAHINVSRFLINCCLVESFGNFAINAIIYRYVLEEKVLKRISLLIFPNLIGAILSIIIILRMDSDKYYGRIISTCLCTASFAFFIIFYYWIKYKTFFNKRYWKYALAISLPLILNGLSVNILNTSDRTIITYYCGATETAIYSLAYSVAWVSNVVTTSAESMWIPNFTNAMVAKDYKKINRDIEVYIYIGLFAFCGLLTAAPEFIILMGGEQYTASIDVAVPLIASLFIMFLYGIYVSEELYYKKTKTVASSTIIAATLNLVLNFIFIPKYGGVAAAMTTLVSYIVSFILHHHRSKKIDDRVAPDSLIVFPIIIFSISAIVTFLLRYHIVTRWIFMLVLGAVYVFYVYRRLKIIFEK